MQYFWTYVGIIVNALRNSKHSLNVLHEFLDITVVVTKLKNVLGSLCFVHFVVFLVRFVICSSNGREPLNIFIWIFVYLSFSKYKVIAVATTEVVHTRMSTLGYTLYVHAYLYASRFIFIFKVAVMSIIGCNNACYWDSLLINRNININNCMDLRRDT